MTLDKFLGLSLTKNKKLLVIGVALAGGFYLWRRNQQKAQPSITLPIPVPTSNYVRA